MLGWSLRDAAKNADMAVATVLKFERGGVVYSSTLDKLKTAYESAGVEIIGEDTVRWRGEAP